MAYNRLVPFNRDGTIGLETIDAKIINNTLTYYFAAHPYVNTPFNGELLIHFVSPSPAELTADMPIYFETQGIGSRRAVTKAGGTPLLAKDITVPGYAKFFYDFRTGVVEAEMAIVNVPTDSVNKK